MSKLVDINVAIDAINELHDKPNTWLDLAVEALEKLPSAPLYTPDELQTMQDLEWSQMEKMYELGKAEALQRTQMSLTEPQEEPNAEWRRKHYEMSYNQGFVDACKYYENLLEHKKGKWIHDNPNTFKCSKCNKYLDIGCGNMKMNFCPNCGSYNGGEQSEKIH